MLAMSHMRGPLPAEHIEALRQEPFCMLTGLPQRFADKLKWPFVICGCWEWSAAKSANGYGRVKVKGQLLTTHRVVYELLIGEIPAGCVLEHLCKTRACCNPFHLVPVTQQENVHLGDAKLFGAARY